MTIILYDAEPSANSERVRILPLDPWADAATVHRWTSDPGARFWGMNGLDRDEVAAVYAHLAGKENQIARSDCMGIRADGCRRKLAVDGFSIGFHG